MISFHHRAFEILDDLDAFARVGVVADDVAEADEVRAVLARASASTASSASRLAWISLRMAKRIVFSMMCRNSLMQRNIERFFQIF